MLGSMDLCLRSDTIPYMALLTSLVNPATTWVATLKNELALSLHRCSPRYVLYLGDSIIWIRVVHRQ